MYDHKPQETPHQHPSIFHSKFIFLLYQKFILCIFSSHLKPSILCPPSASHSGLMTLICSSLKNEKQSEKEVLIFLSLNLPT